MRGERHRLGSHDPLIHWPDNCLSLVTTNFLLVQLPRTLVTNTRPLGPALQVSGHLACRPSPHTLDTWSFYGVWDNNQCKYPGPSQPSGMVCSAVPGPPRSGPARPVAGDWGRCSVHGDQWERQDVTQISPMFTPHQLFVSFAQLKLFQQFTA